ncbi:DUF5050 domain-containing protein [Tissierella creatinini]|nr:DUF5050 domain-containing protein [Tissierella creatinini]TJX60652.1 DUF5050 domain-containing protein [Soehngenia saccharolytica]
MKNILRLLIIIILCIPLMTGCEATNSTTISRIMENDGWIYYTNIKEGTLYKMKPDMTEKIKVADIGNYMVFQGDTIYFFDREGDISKIGTDGTGYAKVADVSEENMFGFYVSGDWIYYPLKTGSIYKIKTDGMEKTKIADISSFQGAMIVSGDWIYYKDDISLYKMRTEGTDTEKLADNVDLFEVKDDWIYYGEITEKGDLKNIYRMKADGTEKSKLVDGAFTAIDGNWLYYSKEGWLYRSNLDGSEGEKINNEDMFNICVIHDDYIYYIEYSGAGYRSNLDGSNKIRIED